MKKIVGLVAVLTAVVLGAYVFMTVMNNPEKKIIGEWTNENNKYSIKFSENGGVDIPVEFFDLGFEADITGKYSMDKKEKNITFTFSFLLVDYSKTYDFKMKGDSLTLTNESTGKSTVFTRQKSAEQNLQSPLYIWFVRRTVNKIINNAYDCKPR